MEPVKLTAIVASKCSAKSIGFDTEPMMTEEITSRAAQYLKDKGHKFSLKLEDGFVVAENVQFPAEGLSDVIWAALEKACVNMELEREKAATERANMLHTYAEKNGGLPII